MFADYFTNASARLSGMQDYLILGLLTYSMEQSLEKLTSFQLVKKVPAFMEPVGSLRNSQMPITYPYPEPARSSPFLHIQLPEDPS